VVGPHSLNHLREWLAVGAITSSAQVCKEGEQNWIPLSDVPKIDFTPASVRERIERRRAQMNHSWHSAPASEKQLFMLKYFEIPFDVNDLTKVHASELIDCFTAIDPGREEQYYNRPATSEQVDTLNSVGVEGQGLTYSDALHQIREKSDVLKGREQHEIDLMILDNMVNDDDVLELCHYRRICGPDLERLLDQLNLSMLNCASGVFAVKFALLVSNLAKFALPLPQDIGSEGCNAPFLLHVRREPCLAVFGNLNVPALPCFRDRRWQFHKIFVQVDCGPVEPQGFRPSKTTKKRDCQKRNKLSFVFCSRGKYLGNFCGGVKLDLHGLPPRQIEPLTWIYGTMAALDAKVEQPAQNADGEIPHTTGHGIHCQREVCGCEGV